MPKKKREGNCHICGTYGPLTFEHVPPEAAFNDRRLTNPKIEDYLDKGPDFVPRYAKIEQKGAGGYTLCGYCNNNTGTWYAPTYISMAAQAAFLLLKSNGELSLHYPYRLFPLRFIKQVVAMFCSVNRPEFIRHHPDLMRFLLNKEEKYLDPKINIYMYLTTSARSRQSGMLSQYSDGKIKIYSEIAFAPLGFIMTFDSFPPDDRLLEISYFSRYDYNRFDIFHLKLPVLPISYYLPGDFRSRDEIMRDYDQNISGEV